MRKVPVILQLAATDCGAACLAMILGAHGRSTRLDECRERCGVGRDGSTTLGLVQAARSFGLRVRSYSVALADFAHVPLPAIVFWNFNHYLVVERWTEQHVDVVDPAQGRRRLPRAEFDAGFTGVTLTFESGDTFDRRASEQSFTWRTYLRALLATPRIRGAIGQILAASLLLQVLGLALPLLTKVVVDRVLPAGQLGALPVLGLGLLAWVAADAATSYLRSLLVISVQARLDGQVMLGFFEHLLALPWGFFQQRTSGDLLMRLGSNMLLREILTSQSIAAVLDGLLVVTYTILLLTWQPLFGVVVIAIGALQVLLLLVTRRRVHHLAQQDLAAQADSQGYLVEALTGIGMLKAAGAEDRVLEHWSSLFFRHLNVSMRRSHLAALIDTGMLSLRLVAPLLLLVLGAQAVIAGRMSLGTMLALNALAASFLAPLSSLVGMGQNLQLVGAHLARIADVLQSPPEQDPGRARDPGPLGGRIEVRNLSFRYQPGSAPALQEVSLAIEPGQKVALVGRTGSGKSTLLRLLLGLYQPEQGEIRFGGTTLRDLDLRALRRRCGVVLQEAFLFSGSIRHNIALNDPALTLEQVQEAARLAVIHDEIAAMPMGYETMLAEGGADLSGGQRQRLAIARALAHQPDVLLLDEASSHLDAITEARLEDNLNRLRCTRLVIAHRLSTVRTADLIVVLDQGYVVEQGTHAELLALGGVYARLVAEQMDGSTSGTAPR